MDAAIVVPFIFVGIPWVLGNVYRAHLSHLRYMKVLQLKADMNARLLDRAGSDPAAVELLKSEANQQLFNIPQEAPAPYMRMLTSLQTAFMLLSGGGASLWFATKLNGNYDSQRTFEFLGALGIALGIGALFSAVAALVVARLWKSLNAAA